MAILKIVPGEYLNPDALEKLIHGYVFRKALRIVAHHGMVVDRDAQGAEFLRNHLRVRVGDIAQQQFRSDSNQFRRH